MRTYSQLATQGRKVLGHTRYQDRHSAGSRNLSGRASQPAPLNSTQKVLGLGVVTHPLSTDNVPIDVPRPIPAVIVGPV